VPRCVYAEDAAFISRPLAIEVESLLGSQSAFSSLLVGNKKMDAQADNLPTVGG
jgi:hypothetical protein